MSNYIMIHYYYGNRICSKIIPTASTVLSIQYPVTSKRNY